MSNSSHRCGQLLGIPLCEIYKMSFKGNSQTFPLTLRYSFCGRTLEMLGNQGMNIDCFGLIYRDVAQHLWRTGLLRRYTRIYLSYRLSRMQATPARCSPDLSSTYLWMPRCRIDHYVTWQSSYLVQLTFQASCVTSHLPHQYSNGWTAHFEVHKADRAPNERTTPWRKCRIFRVIRVCPNAQGQILALTASNSDGACAPRAPTFVRKFSDTDMTWSSKLIVYSFRAVPSPPLPSPPLQFSTLR